MASHNNPLIFSLVITLSLILCVAAHGGHQDADDQNASPPSDQPNLRAKSLILVKVWCLILVFVGTFVGGISPYFLKWNETFLVLGTQFAGGVFLGTAIMHFLSDANETFQDLTSKEYPFAFMLACAGYLLTLWADCLLVYVYGKNNNLGSLSKSNSLEEGLPGEKTNNHPTYAASQSQACNGTNIHHLANAKELATASSVGDTILLIAALCFHSVFEGIAIGVSKTASDAWKALWTISLHKIFAAIAMAIALLRMIPDRPFLSCAAYAFAFAISSPIGVAIGIIIDQTAQGAVADWIFAISMGIACGVFVYVSINHLLSKGYCPDKRVGFDTPFWRLLAVVLGVGVIAVVMIWDT
ncbi:hypothetical protein Cgig2_028511 [Carnegiea gigantea]|uniref:Zinc transporter 11 n=1 Tax=Carnegiea gigantea TaxID=171969 RepID=A0A9Q1JMA6_9CARY|nr:hypothetical protein Cgig2_028511 [Carnegiea gigantea]